MESNDLNKQTRIFTAKTKENPTINESKKSNCSESQEPQNLNYNKTKFKTPMGSSGHLVGVFPVILSEFETDIYCELKYKYPIHSIKTKESKIIVKKFKLVAKNRKLLIEGYVEKKLLICFDVQRKEENTLITIPFKTIVDITYSNEPKYDTEYKSNSKNNCSSEHFFSPAEKLFWVHEYTKLKEEFEEIEYSNSKEYVTKLIITLGLSILQNQKVFIPEPCGDANVVAEYDACGNIKTANEIAHVEVGFDTKKGLVARIIKQ